MNKIPKLREPKGPVVQQVRDLFLDNDYKEAPEDFYEEDVKLIENMDFLLQRYVIMQRKNVDSSVRLVSQMLKWRREKKLYEMRESQFPQELSICGAAFMYENDKFGNRTLYLRANMCKNCAELKASMKDFMTYLLFEIDDPKEGTPFAVIMDLTNTTWTNYDIDLLMHFVALLKDYFPVNLDYVLAINFPWILSAAWSLIKRLIPSEKRDVVQFIDSKKVFDFVPKENCPDFLGGTCTRSYRYVNEKSPTAIEYMIHEDNRNNTGKLINRKRIKEILNMFDDILPKDHMMKLLDQLSSLNEETLELEQSGNNNNNNSDSVNNNNIGESEKPMKNKNQENRGKTKQKGKAK